MAAKRALILVIVLLLIMPAWPAAVRRERTRTARQRSAEKPAAKAAPAAAASDDGGVSFESFALITQRNIFDPTRQPYRAPGAAGARAESAPVADTIDLLGVLIDSGKSVAFTDGSNAEYKQTIAPGATIAGMKVVAISTDGMQMEVDSQRLDWPVGKRLVRREGRPWEVADSPRFAITSEPRQTLAQTRPSGGMNRGAMGNWGGNNNGNNDGGRRRNRDGGGQASYNQNQQRGSTPAQASAGRGSGASADEIRARLIERRRREMGQ